jgi:hypothetical protein
VDRQDAIQVIRQMIAMRARMKYLLHEEEALRMLLTMAGEEAPATEEPVEQDKHPCFKCRHLIPNLSVCFQLRGEWRGLKDACPHFSKKVPTCKDCISFVAVSRYCPVFGYGQGPEDNICHKFHPILKEKS